MDAILMKELALLPKNFLPKVPERPEKKDRCIPLRARTWESPAREKSLQRLLSVYSREPESRESISPPALPHLKSILLNTRRHFARKCVSFPERFASGFLYSSEWTVNAFVEGFHFPLQDMFSPCSIKTDFPSSE